MIKQVATAATVVAIGVLAVGSSSSAGQSASTSSPRHTFTVVEVETESGSVDRGQEGFYMGDEGAVWTANLRWDGKVVGQDSGFASSPRTRSLRLNAALLHSSGTAKSPFRS